LVTFSFIVSNSHQKRDTYMSAVDFNLKPIESEVFRFISVRNPQRVTKAGLRLWAVNYGAEEGSALFEDLVAAIADPANATETAKLAACKTLAESYHDGDDWIDDVDSLDVLLPYYVGLYDWLQVNLSSLTIASVTAKLGSVGAMDSTVALRVWDNLFARLILGGEGVMRTALMESLILDYLVANYSDTELVTNADDLKRMVNGRVVLPKEVFPLPYTNMPITTTEGEELPDFSEEKATLLASISQYEVAMAELQRTLDDIREEIHAQIPDPMQGAITVTEETVFPDLNPVLTEDSYDALSSPTKLVLEANSLGVGKRFSYCFQVLDRKLGKLNADFFDGLEFGRRVIATGGAVWEPSVAKGDPQVGCDPEQLPDIGTAQAYEDFYFGGLGNAGCRIKPLGIGDLLRVEQKLCCYAPGEVAHIENILQGEYKERATRRFRRTEETYTVITDKQTTDERDTISTDQFEMQKSSSDVMQEDMAFSVGLSASYLGPVKVNVNSNFATSTSQTTSNETASSYARSVTDRALKRIVERTYTERVRKVIEEYEETQKHGLDNRGGTAHVVGLYRWADKIYEAKLVNYGKRLMFEFLIPEPAAFHIWAMSKPGAANAVQLEMPIDPRSTDVSTMNYGLHPLTELGINGNNWHFWAAAYGVTLDPPPVEEQIVSKSYAGDNFDTGTSFARSYSDLVVPVGYHALSWNAYVLYNSASPNWVTLSVGTHHSYFFNQQVGNRSGAFQGNVVGTVPVSIIGGSDFFALNVHVWCRILPNAFMAWQRDCFDRVMQAYFQKKAAYDQALAEVKAGYGSALIGTNPAMNRQIERGELKKGCLTALFNGANFSSNAIVNYDSLIDCAPPLAQTNCCAVYEGERAKFLEQVFDWDFMSYLLYPYFHGQRCRWKKLYQMQDSDPDFLKFLQSGMARVIVPVRPSYEEVAMHFLRTGEIWGGGPVPAIKSDLYLSITQELMGAVLYTGDVDTPTWEVRVPTTLSVLQCESGCTSGSGLPCDCGTGIATGTSTMVGGGGDPATPG
jgi:hypothetical protein